MPRLLLLLCCALGISSSQGCGDILYSSLGESVLFPCERNKNQTPTVATSAPPEQSQDLLPTQWHFLAPSGEMHPLAAWHPNGRLYRAGGSRQSRVDLLTDASLQVLQLQLSDAGQYICFRSDIFGATTFLRNITLVITGPPTEWSSSTPSVLHLLLGALLGSKCLILIIVLGCSIGFGRKKEQSAYANVTE